MVIDHIAATVIDKYLLSSADTHEALLILDDVMRCIGRLAFPLFCFLIIEGFTHTGNPVKYLRNLLIFALISELPFDLALGRGVPFFIYSQNVIFTLFLGVFTLCIIKIICSSTFESDRFNIFQYLGSIFGALCVVLLWRDSFLSEAIVSAVAGGITDNASLISLFAVIPACAFAVFYLLRQTAFTREQKIRDALCLLTLLVTMLLAEILRTDYGCTGVLVIAMMYLLSVRCKADKRMVMLVGSCVLLFLNPVEIFGLLGVIPIAFYNGKRGVSLKYFFYIFYPAHLIILFGICLIMKII